MNKEREIECAKWKCLFLKISDCFHVHMNTFSGCLRVSTTSVLWLLI